MLRAYIDTSMAAMSINLLTGLQPHGREIHQTTVSSAFIRNLVECALGSWGVNVRPTRERLRASTRLLLPRRERRPEPTVRI